MNITQTKEDSRLTVALEGSLDATTAYQFDHELMSSLNGITELILDLEKLDFVSSAGLRVLLSAQKTMNNQGTMEVINVCDDVMDIFVMTGFASALTIRR